MMHAVYFLDIINPIDMIHCETYIMCNIPQREGLNLNIQHENKNKKSLFSI